MGKSVIPRAALKDQKIVRQKCTGKEERSENEVAKAYDQVGDTPNRSTKSWYRDIYEFYQDNEV